MKLGTILLGTAVGIGAVAAAPFTGGGSVLGGATLLSSLAGAGAVTAGAAVVGGGVGAYAGMVSEEQEEEQRKNAKKTGFEDGLKKGEEAVLKKLILLIKDIEKRDNYLIALTAICYAAANCDGSISKEEKDELDYNLNYINKNAALPKPLIKKLTEIKDNKNTFEQILELLHKIEYKDLLIFGEVIDDIFNADGMVPEEEEFKDKWEKYCEQRKES